MSQPYLCPSQKDDHHHRSGFFRFGCLGHMGCVSPCRDAWLSLPPPRSGGGGHILGMKPTKMITTATPTDPNIPLEGPLGPTSKKCRSRENRASGGGGHSRGPYYFMLLSSSRKQAHNRRVINYIQLNNEPGTLQLAANLNLRHFRFSLLRPPSPKRKVES